MKCYGKRIWMLVVVVVCFLLSACSNDESDSKNVTGSQADNVKISDDSIFGTFSSKTVDGTDIDQAIFSKADLTMVNIWATYCGPCINEMPELAEISNEYADKNFQIIGIISDVTSPNDKNALDVIKSTRADYTHIIMSEDLYSGYMSGVQAVPTTVFVNAEGKQVGEEYVGAYSKDKWISIIENLLNK